MCFVPLPEAKSSFLFGSVRDFLGLGDAVLGAWLPPAVGTRVIILQQLCVLCLQAQAQLVSEQWSCDKHSALYLHFKDKLWPLCWGEAFGQAVGKYHCFRSSLLLLPCSHQGAALREGNISPALHCSKALFAVGSHSPYGQAQSDLGSPSRCPVVFTLCQEPSTTLLTAEAEAVPVVPHGWSSVLWGWWKLVGVHQVQCLGCSGRDKVLLCSSFVVHQNQFEISFRVALQCKAIALLVAFPGDWKI